MIMDQLKGQHTSMLAVGSSAEERRALANIFGSILEINTVNTCREARNFLARRPTPVVITDRDLTDGSWRDVLSAIGSSGHFSSLIVACRHADEKLWADVLHMGGFDVLATPFDPTEVSRTVGAALRNRKRAASRAAG
jgi:DNA-binding NtrC family response regulator